MKNDELVDMYRKTLQIRKFEEKVKEEIVKGNIEGFVHLSIGQEAIAVGALHGLRSEDYITPAHRGHGTMIARGVSMREMFAELLGKPSGVCGGRGGSFHMLELEKNIFPINGILGASSPIATGSALAIKMRKEDKVHLNFFGDGQVNEGAIHEAMNFAGVNKLPIIFICENNMYASAGVKHTLFVPIENIADRAVAYGMVGEVVDGMNPIAINEVVMKATERARRGEGPTLIECKTYRYADHVEGFEDMQGPDKHYRSREEFEKWKKRDPVKNLKENILDANIFDQSELDVIEEEINEEVENAYNEAVKDPNPDKDEVKKHVYCD